MISTEDAPRWAIVTHYGWRFELMSWFPNALGIERAEGPDPDLTPWFNIVFVTVLTLALLAIWRFLQAMFRRNVDPVLDEIDEQRGAFRRFWRRTFG